MAHVRHQAGTAAQSQYKHSIYHGINLINSARSHEDEELGLQFALVALILCKKARHITHNGRYGPRGAYRLDTADVVFDSLLAGSNRVFKAWFQYFYPFLSLSIGLI